MKKKLMALCLATLAGRACGLDLSQAQDLAAASSPELKGMDAALDGAGWGRLEAASGFLPHLSLQGNQVLEQKYLYLGVLFGGPAAIRFPEAFPSSTLDLVVSETFFDGFGSWQSFGAASQAEKAAALERDFAAFKLKRQVGLAFDRALAAQQFTQVADQNIATLQEHLDIVSASEDSGLATRFDVLRVQSKLEEAKADRLLKDDNLALAKRNLAQLMGLTQGVETLEGSLPVPSPDAAAKALARDGILQRPDITALELRLQAAQGRAGASAAFWWPRLSAYGSLEYYRYDSYDPAIVANPSYQNDYTVGLNLNWDLFDGGLSLARQKEAQAGAVQAAQALEGLRRKAPDEAELWRRRYLYNSSLYLARQRTVDESQESVRLADLGLKAGTLTHSESLDAESDLFQAKAGLVQAQLDAAEAFINLELALGQSLD